MIFAGVWVSVTHACSPGCWCLSPPRGCQELQRLQQADSGWVRLPELCATRFPSRASRSFQSLLDTQRTQFFLFSLTGTSQSRPIRALITPRHWWGSIAVIYTPSFSTVSPLPGSSSDPHADILREPTSQPALFFSSFQRRLWIETFFKKSNVYKCMLLFSNFLLITVKLSKLSLFIPLSS